MLIAIAGAIAAVLFSSAQDASNELENASVSVNVWTARNDGQCQRSGGDWKSAAATGEDLGALRAANSGTGVSLVGWDRDGQPATALTAGEITAGGGYCKPF